MAEAREEVCFALPVEVTVWWLVRANMFIISILCTEVRVSLSSVKSQQGVK